MTTNLLEIKENILEFRLDYLTIFWTFKQEKDYFDKLNFENTATSIFWKYNIIKVEIPRHKYKIIFNYNNYSVFAYEKWEKYKQWVTKSQDKIIVYWTWFKTLPKEIIFNFLNDNFDLRHTSRADICIDINKDISDILKNFNENKIRTWEEIKKNWKIVTKYIWEKNKYKNKRYLIRIYDKKLDIKDKRREKLYKEYLAEKFITRVELELRSIYAKNIFWYELFNDKCISWIFKHELSKFTDIFSFINDESISLLKPFNINEDNFQSLAYDMGRRLNAFIWSATSIYEIWFCPVRILIWEWVIHDRTKKILWYGEVSEIIKREKEQKLLYKNRWYIRINDLFFNDKKYGWR